jgi:hypothetical protein
VWQHASLTQAIPVLEVTDVAENMAWYREVLGFIADPFPQSPRLSLRFCGIAVRKSCCAGERPV